MNLLPDDPKAAAKLILRDTSAHGTPNVVLFPGTTNQDAEQWAKPINALTSQEQSRPLDSFPIDPYEPSAKEDGHFSEGDGGYNVISIPSRDERSAGQSDGQPDIEAADSPANVLGTTYQPVPEQNLPDWARRGLAATEREAGGRGKVSVVQLGIKNPPGKSSTLRFSAELFSLFRKRILFVKGTEKPLPFDGMISPDDPNTLIIDADAPSGLTYLFGHELGHSIQHQRPDLYDAFQKELLAMPGDWRDYGEKLHASYRTEEQFRAVYVDEGVSKRCRKEVRHFMAARSGLIAVVSMTRS